MAGKIVVGPLTRGLRNDVESFNLDNENFYQLSNAYQWRKRIKRKRGTSLLGRLKRQIDTTDIGTTGATPWNFNIFTVNSITPEDNASVVPGSVQIFINPANLTGNLVAPGYTRSSNCEVFTTPTGLSTGDQVTISGVNVVSGTGPATINGGPWNNIEVLGSSIKLNVDSRAWGKWSSGGTWTKISGSIVFQDQGDGTLTSSTGGNSGTIDYLTGDITLTHTAGAGVSTDATFEYYPNLPVMGLEEFDISVQDFPTTVGFDTKYSYNISSVAPYDIYNTNFFKNPSTGDYSGYNQKAADTEFVWNGEDYQQFYTTNYEGAFWATNGIEQPFSPENIGMQFKSIDSITVSSPTECVIGITAHGLVQGDFIFINEVTTTTGINFQTGYVTSADPQAANSVTVTFPNATIATNSAAEGIAQYLTNISDATKDCIRWSDGDPTTSPYGWVNFCPPLSYLSYSIADLTPQQYYLVGARVIFPFKDRLLFFGPVIQTSAGNDQTYLPDTIIYSQNGTPFYTCSFTGDPRSSATTFNPILVPDDKTATASAFFEDSNGFGGFIQVANNQQIVTVSSNEDALILGFDKSQVRLVYTGNDIVPFNFFAINSELGSTSTFSTINMDEGVVTRGDRGYVITNQRSCKRIDLDVPDEVFEIRNTDNGSERLSAQRDFINEWIYFTYPSDTNSGFPYPDKTLLFNYRDNSYGIFYENYTTYGPFRKRTGYTWETIGLDYPTWSDWKTPWDAGSSELLEPKVIAGNQQGFVLIRDEGLGEGNSLYISDITSNVITSPNHGLGSGVLGPDYIIISGCLGTIGQEVNSKIFSVTPLDNDTFSLNPTIGSGTYIGGGVIKRLYRPFIQSKSFPVAWEMGRKTRLGAQQYLLSYTEKSQVTLLIYLSQDVTTPYNDTPVIPESGSLNNSLVYSTVLYTCPESENLGLTAANTNLQMPTAQNQDQIWHRINTSLIGDTVQVAFTLSDAQMSSLDISGEVADITGATQANPCVLTCDGLFSSGQLILIEDVEGMTELNDNYYRVISSDGTNVTIEVDSSAFSAYSEGGTATPYAPLNQFAEIELHGFILDVSPSMVLS